MSKYFTNIEVQDRKGNPNDLFTFKMKDVLISSVIGNCLRRVIGLDIPVYSISPESFVVLKNTSSWDKDRLIHQLSYLPLIQESFEKIDLNMVELHLDIKNESKENIDILSNRLKFYNKEKDKNIDNDNFILYDNYLLVEDFLPFQEIKLKCQVEYKTKRNSSAIHQAGTVGLDYVIDSKDNSRNFPSEISFIVTLQTGINPKQLILKAFDILINRFDNIEKAIEEKDSSVFYIELNRNNRYDFVFIGEDHTLGSLIEKWNNRHDTNSVTGYRLTTDTKSIKIDYGLSKFSVKLEIDNDVTKDKILDSVEKSIYISEKDEKKQRDETVKSFLINLDRIRKYLSSLKTDFEKVKINNIPLEDFNKTYFNNRTLRANRLKK
jgi:DNA-directed RNA polymerase subunit L